jgi:hypothetical protein
MVEDYLAGLDPASALAIRGSLPEAAEVIGETGLMPTDQTRLTAFVEAVTASNGLATKTDDGSYRLLRPAAKLTEAWVVPLGGCTHHTWLVMSGDLKRAAVQESCQSNDVLLWNSAASVVQRIHIPASITVARGFDEGGSLLLALSRGDESKISTYRWDEVGKKLLMISSRDHGGYSDFNCRNMSKDIEGLFYVAMKNEGRGGQAIARWRGKDYVADLDGTPFGDCAVASQDGSPLIILRTQSEHDAGRFYELKALAITPEGLIQRRSVKLPDQDSNIVGISEGGDEVYVEQRGFSQSTIFREIQALRLGDGARRIVLGKLPITGGVTGVVSSHGPAASLATAGEGMLTISSLGVTCANRVNAEWTDQRVGGVAFIDANSGAMSAFVNKCSAQSAR